ncbi:MAG: AsmA family protein [Pseudomonadota bacterium]
MLLLSATMAFSFWLVPKDRLNQLIETQLSEAFGHDVKVRGRATVTVLPYLAVTFGPVTVSGDNASTAPMAEIERASGRLSVMSLWDGSPALRYLEIENAKIRVARYEDGNYNWAAAQFFLEPEDETAEETGLRFPERLRFITLKNSTLFVENPDFDKPVTLNDMNLKIVGPPRSGSLAIDGDVNLRGERLAVDIDLARPGLFASGRASAAEISVAGERLEATFKGDLTVKDEITADGSLEADIPSARVLASWLGFKGSRALPDEALRLIGDGVFTSNDLNFRPIAVRMAGGKADGRLAVDLSRETVDISGTLAFDSLALHTAGEEENPHLSLLQEVLAITEEDVRLDIRLSADSAKIARYNFTELAATLVLSEDTFSITIGSAELEGLGIDGEAQLSFGGGERTLNADIIVRNAAADSLRDYFELSQPINGQMTLAMGVQAKGTDARSLAKATELEFSVDVTSGALSGVWLPAVFSKTQGLDQAAINNPGFQTPFDRALIHATVEQGGRLNLRKITMVGADFEVSATGHTVPSTGDLVAAGQIVTTESDAQTEGEGLTTKFMIVGPLDKPRISVINDVDILTPVSGQ